WYFAGSGPTGEFFAGYITEKSLSVDNLFVFVLIMGKFAVPSQYQQRVLMVGVLMALVLRAVFIAAGAAIITAFSWVFYIFGAFLVWTAWKLIQDARKQDHEEEYQENKLLKMAEQRFGVADRYHGTKLFITENGKRIMTPMLVVMLAIGSTDVLFALDSIPAIYGLTQDPYIVFTANAFALMGLRQLYFLIGGLLKKLVHLSYGLSIILGFIGVKLVLHALHESGVHVPEISIPFSLTFIVLVLAVTTITSLRASKKQEA
ncbi:TerC/Alx family metal homeostasis membrane protein, partial [Streptomyces caelestis]